LPHQGVLGMVYSEENRNEEKDGLTQFKRTVAKIAVLNTSNI